MSGQALKIKRMLARYGEQVTYQARAVGSRDATTSRAALTYSVETSIMAVIGRATSRANPQESGSVTDTVREFTTQYAIARGGRVVLNDGTYVVETVPTEIDYKGSRLAYSTVLKRLEFE